MKLTGQYDLQYFKASKYFQLDMERIKPMADLIQNSGAKTVLDVGCGLGTLVKELRHRGIEAFGTDSAVALKSNHWIDYFFILSDAKFLPFGSKTFDLVFSSDFFEHIREEDVDVVANEMKRVGKKVVASIAFEEVLNERQKKYHLTNKPREWWVEKLNGVTVL